MAHTILKGAVGKLLPAEYYRFVAWSSTPRLYRDPKTIEALAEEMGVSRQTLHAWKNEANFAEDVHRALMAWSKDLTPDVVGAIYHTARAGNPQAQKLWLQFVEQFAERREDKRVIDVPQDLRGLLLQLHEERLSMREAQPVEAVRAFSTAADAVRDGDPPAAA